jgi:polyketide biosynthesis enoyl-CoA hydratase PksI
VSQPVVTLHDISDGVGQITLLDKENKNTFSDQLVHDLIEVFASVTNNPRYRALVLTGYDTYFATGGTKAGLLAIADGKGSFNATNFYSLALQCDIPVISAMQGHAVGGGFVMGLFSDFVVMSRESIYTTNFMRYGFTPGMGATYVVPHKLGFALGQELLLNARNYRGADLEKRGVPFPVMPRKEVLPYAYEVAKDLAEKPRLSLVTLKGHLVRDMRRDLDDVVQRELKMHDITFHHEEVKQRIERLF